MKEGSISYCIMCFLSDEPYQEFTNQEIFAYINLIKGTQFNVCNGSIMWLKRKGYIIARKVPSPTHKGLTINRYRINPEFINNF